MKPYQKIGFPERDMSDFDVSFQHGLSFSPALALGEVTYSHTSYVVCHHLGLMEVPDWRLHARSCCEEVIKQFSDSDFNQPWFAALSNAMLCGTYAGLWNEMAILSELNMYLLEEDYLGRAPRELQYIMLEVLYSVSERQFEPSEAAVESMSSISNKQAQRYLRLWRTVETLDQDQFVAVLKDSVSTFSRRKKPPADATFPLEWIAQFESIVANLALHRGMILPPIPEKQRPLLMVAEGAWHA